MIKVGSRSRRIVLKTLKGLIIPVLILLLWQWVLLDVYEILPPLNEVVEVLSRYYLQAEFLNSLLASVRRVVLGYSIGVTVGVSLGIAMGLSRVVADLTDPIIEMLRPIAPIAWVPLAITWFGLTEKAAVFIIAYAVMFPLMVNTIASVQGVNRLYVQAAQTLGIPRLSIIRGVIIPGAMPGIVTGLRVGLGLSWAVIVAAELTVGYMLRTGLGYITLYYSQVVFNVPRILAAVIAIGAMGFLTDRLLRWLEDKVLPWRVEMRLR